MFPACFMLRNAGVPECESWWVKGKNKYTKIGRNQKKRMNRKKEETLRIPDPSELIPSFDIDAFFNMFIPGAHDSGTPHDSETFKKDEWCLINDDSTQIQTQPRN